MCDPSLCVCLFECICICVQAQVSLCGSSLFVHVHLKVRKGVEAQVSYAPLDCVYMFVYECML